MSGVGDDILAGNADWNFGGDVPRAFDRHVVRSIPLYLEGHDLIARISDYFISDTSLVYDLGSSTGELLKKLADRHKGKNIRFVGVEREAEMVRLAREKGSGDPRIHFEEEELTQFPLEKADLIVSYYTIQFIRPAVRQELFQRIYQSLNWGGAFLLFEKVRGPDARFQDILTGLYTDYKLDRGYSADEIVAKSRSLKGVLEPFSTQGNQGLLERAGFQDYMTVLKYICFEGILAIK